MLTTKERLELDELERVNKNFSAKVDHELEDKYEYDNRIGAVLLLVSYCGIAVFMIYKVIELLVERFS